MNKVILIGRLGRDPEERKTSGGMSVCNLNLATSQRRKVQGRWEDATEWHRCVCFAGTADLAVKYLAKGRQVAIDGELRTNKWQDREGVDHWTTEIVVNRLEFVGDAGGGRRDRGYRQEEAQPVSDGFVGGDGAEDDVPF